MSMRSSMISKQEFTDAVEKLVTRGKGSDVMSAILRVCEDNGLEPESAKRLLSQPLKEKLQAEAQQLNLIDRGKTSQGTITSFYKD